MDNLKSQMERLKLDGILPNSIKLMCYYQIVSPLTGYSMKHYLRYTFINATYLCSFGGKVYNDEVTAYLMNNTDKIKFIDTEKCSNCTIQYVYMKKFIQADEFNKYDLTWNYYWDFFNITDKINKKTNIYKFILKHKNNISKMNRKLDIIINRNVKYRFKLIKLYKNIRKNYIKLKK